MNRYVSVCDGEVVGDVCLDIDVARNKAKEFLLEDLEKSYKLAAYVAVVVERITIDPRIKVEAMPACENGS